MRWVPASAAAAGSKTVERQDAADGLEGAAEMDRDSVGKLAGERLSVSTALAGMNLDPHDLQHAPTH